MCQHDTIFTNCPSTSASAWDVSAEAHRLEIFPRVPPVKPCLQKILADGYPSGVPSPVSPSIPQEDTRCKSSLHVSTYQSTNWKGLAEVPCRWSFCQSCHSIWCYRSSIPPTIPQWRRADLAKGPHRWLLPTILTLERLLQKFLAHSHPHRWPPL